ncbi:MAG: leucine-rich repeat protein [Treponema sp.]|nr:leucine-rich repeat protein [Treponema sp.]
MKKFLGLAAIIAALGFLFAAAGCSNASDSNNAALLGLLNGTPAQPTTPAQPSTPAPAPTELEIPLTLEAIEDGEITLSDPWSTLKYKINDGELQAPTVKIQTNVQAKQSYEPTYASIQVKAGDKVSFFADGSENDIDNGKLMMIQAQKDCYIYGNIMSLVDSSDYKSKTALNDRAAFAMLFRNNKHIKDHSEKKLVLPATTITYACYSRMFEGCAALTSAPDLPATTLAEYCYNGMFSSCEALTTAPELPATTLAQSCYGSMFSHCDALTTAPALPATTLAQSCYSSMFYGCANLATAPAALPATTLTANCYERMFYQCKKLEKAPDLPAKTLVKECYSEMFYECEKLNYIKCLAEDISASACTSSWLTRTASTGTFIKNNSAQWHINGQAYNIGGYNITASDGIPTNWTVQTAVPEYNISTSGISNGTVTASVNSTNASTAEANATVTLTANPATGYQLSSIAVTKASGEAVTTSGDGLTRTFTMPAENVSVSATFTQISYSITKQTMSHGSVTVDTSSTSNATSAAYNTPVILTIKPDTGYELGSISASTSASAITLSGSGITNGSARTFSMPAGNVTISATFTKINYSITTGGITNGTVTAKDASGQAITSATYGQTVTLVIAAANYYDYTADSISVTGVSNLGGSGLTRTFTMPAQNVTVSATFFTGPTVAATEAKELGDIVLDDGRVVRYADRDKMTASQKSAAVAIIFDAANKKGVGVKIGEKKKWCSDGAGLYNTNEYTISEEDGYANKTAAHPHMVTWSTGAYPAFWFAEVENRKGIYNDDKWYLPASKELITLFANIETVNNSFDALGITTKIVEGDWTWSSSCWDPSKIHQDTQTAAIFVSDSKGTAVGAKTTEIKACGARVFN